MTTAHRPTYHPAVGSANSGGFRFHAPRLLLHSRDLHAHTALKLRQQGQASQEELKGRDLRQELLDRERHSTQQQQHGQRRIDKDGDEDDRDDRETKRSAAHHQPLLLKSEADEEERKEGDTAEDGKGGRSSDSQDPPTATLDLSAVDWSRFNDADAPLSEADDHDEEEDERRSAGAAALDESDDEAELQRELAKIRAEREAERQKQIAADSASTAAASAAASRGDAGLLSSNAFGVKRRWDDDVVFRNQTRGEDVTSKAPKRFINDSIRSDFHRSFMNKYVR